jgi:acid phosphatase
MSRRPLAALAALAVVVLSLTGCGGSSPPVSGGSPPSSAASPSTGRAASPSTGQAAAARPDHLVVAIFENKAYSQVIGVAPAFDQLVASGTSFTNARAITHPSQPNYLALFSGSTHGITGDSCPHTIHAGNLAQQLIDAGASFTGYAEDLPRPGYAGCSSGGYARKHAPWTNFAGLPATVGQPHSAFPADFSRLPSVAFVVPNLCNDMHDCPVRTGDAWLAQHLLPYASWARSHNSLLIVTFDEDNGTPGNQIPTIVVGAGIPVAKDGTRINQYSVLRAIENCFGLPPLGQAATANAPRLCG